MSAKRAALLDIADLRVTYGVIPALKGISLTVNEGEVVALIGANGAGKSTTLRAISGVVPWAGGEVTFRGASLQGLAVHEVAARGVFQVPEGRGIFPNLSVEENLLLGAFARRDGGAIKKELEQVYTLLPQLANRRKQSGGTLSGGEQQMLAIGRALVARPALILMDEPSMGLAPMLVEQVFDIIEDINKAGSTILLVEQNATMALSVAHRVYVLEVGEITHSGTPAALLADDEMHKAYLGR